MIFSFINQSHNLKIKQHTSTQFQFAIDLNDDKNCFIALCFYKRNDEIESRTI